MKTEQPIWPQLRRGLLGQNPGNTAGKTGSVIGCGLAARITLVIIYNQVRDKRGKMDEFHKNVKKMKKT